MTAATTAALETRGLQKSFGGLAVTTNVDLRLERGARQALIGPNGAGKTTLINLISGELAPSAGEVRLDGRDVTGLPAHQRVRLGLRQNLSDQSVVSESSSGRPGSAGARRASSLEPSVVATARCRSGIARRSVRACSTALGLEGQALAPIGTLPYGRQRLVEIALALAARPKVLLLDEPAAGVPAAESDVILDAIEALPADIAVLIVEHDMDLVFRFARRITVMAGGAILTEGPPADIAADERVRQVYLGKRQDA